MKFKIIALCSLALFVTNCTPAKNPVDTKKPTETLTETPKAVEAAKAPAQTCEDGSAPQLINGECTGNWKFVKKDSGAECQFDWGPRITCPEGSKSLGHEAECYGVTTKEVANSDRIDSSAKCMEKFGVRPTEISYTLPCCPK